MNLEAFHLKILFFLVQDINIHSKFSSHMTFRRIKSWYLHFIISQEGWLHFLLAKFTVNQQNWLWKKKKKFCEPRSSRKFITTEKQSLLFFHAYTPKENNILPTDHRALPTSPATLLFWPGLFSLLLLVFGLGENSSLKRTQNNSSTYFQKTYMLRSVVSLDSWLHFKKGEENILRCQAQERLFCPTWSPGDIPYMIIISLLLQVMELLCMKHASTGTKQMLISQTC